MKQGELILAAGSVRSKKHKRKKKKKSRRTHNKPRNTQFPGDRDHLERAYDETLAMRLPLLARFLHRSQVVEISLACIRTYPHCCCRSAACIRFGATYILSTAQLLLSLLL